MVFEFISGIRAYLKGAKYYFKGFTVAYVLVSGVLSLIVFLGLVWLAYSYGDDAGFAFAQGILSDSEEAGLLSTILSWMTRILLWIVIIFVFRYIILIITAPIMGILSEKVEQGETELDIDQSLSIWKQFYLIGRGTRIAISNLGRELSITIVLLLISLIPGAVIVTTPLIFVVQAYYAGFGNLDFFMERRFDTRDSRKFVSKHKGVAIANGSVFLLLLVIPLAGPFIATSFASIAATISGLELLEKDYTF